MALIYADRVQETSTTTGTGTLDLDGADIGFQTFVLGIGTTNTCFYGIETQGGGSEWETGIGTVTSGAPDTLSRDTVLDGSAGVGVAVSFSAGTKTVFCYQVARAHSTEWEAYTPTLSWTGGVAAPVAFWRRIGPDTIEVSYVVPVTGAVTPPATPLTISLPPGFTVATGKLTPAPEHVLTSNAVAFDATGPEFAGFHVVAPGVVIAPKVIGPGFPGTTLLTDALPFIWATGDEAKGTFQVPVNE